MLIKLLSPSISEIAPTLASNMSIEYDVKMTKIYYSQKS